jgi:low affinity Fe/Cu permease
MLILPIVGGSWSAYLRAIGIPIGLTLGCIAVFLEIVQVVAFGEGTQLVVAAMIAVAGIVGSAFIQRSSLIKEMAFLQAATA